MLCNHIDRSQRHRKIQSLSPGLIAVVGFVEGSALFRNSPRGDQKRHAIPGYCGHLRDGEGLGHNVLAGDSSYSRQQCIFSVLNSDTTPPPAERITVQYYLNIRGIVMIPSKFSPTRHFISLTLSIWIQLQYLIRSISGMFGTRTAWCTWRRFVSRPPAQRGQGVNPHSRSAATSFSRRYPRDLLGCKPPYFVFQV